MARTTSFKKEKTDKYNLKVKRQKAKVQVKSQKSDRIFSNLIIVGSILLILGFLIFILTFFPIIKEEAKYALGSTGFARKTPTDFDLSNFMPIYVGTVVIAFILIAISGYFLGRSYASEYYFKKSLDGVLANNAKQVYDNQRQAIILNPYIERFHNNFAQTNLLIANKTATKVFPNPVGKTTRVFLAKAALTIFS